MQTKVMIFIFENTNKHHVYNEFFKSLKRNASGYKRLCFFLFQQLFLSFKGFDNKIIALHQNFKASTVEFSNVEQNCIPDRGGSCRGAAELQHPLYLS